MNQKLKPEGLVIGRIITIKQEEKIGFISKSTLQYQDGDVFDLPVVGDIFFHFDDVNKKDLEYLDTGMNVLFEIRPKGNEDDGKWRAFGIVRHTALLPMPKKISTNIIKGYAIPTEFPDTSDIIDVPQPLSLRMASQKQIPDAVVKKVLQNQPLKNWIPPEKDFVYGEEGRAFFAKYISAILLHTYPNLQEVDFNYDITQIDEKSEAENLEAEIKSLQASGFHAVGFQINKDYENLKNFRKVLLWLYNTGIARTTSIIPMKFLADFFMAMPVWFHCSNFSEKQNELLSSSWDVVNPYVHFHNQWFLKKFKSQIWTDLFQIFNRRVRTPIQYPTDGDIVRPHIRKLIEEAKNIFPHLIIATPYTWVPAQEMKTDAERKRDPFVLGFIECEQYFFYLGKYSNRGLFADFWESVGNTLGFLQDKENEILNSIFQNDQQSDTVKIHWFSYNERKGDYLGLSPKMTERFLVKN